jgi:magnesium transporter
VISVHKSSGKPVWIDLFSPTDRELAQACETYGLDIPPRARLEEIEFSSRLQYEDGVFTISVPVTPHNSDTDVTTPLGFVLTGEILVTIRFARILTFDIISARLERRPRTAPDVFLVILEGLIDHSADRLEELRARALRISQHIFRKPAVGHRNARRTDRNLNAMLMEIGDLGTDLSHVRETLLVLQRVVPFVTEHGNGWLASALKARLKMAGADIQSLNEYELHLTDKLQFLLDAALGFINTEQNDLFKVMTIWSVAGIPPVLVAGVYGMNFHYMPELSWTLGYPFGLALIVVSAVLPLAWFKWRGWW